MKIMKIPVFSLAVLLFACSTPQKTDPQTKVYDKMERVIRVNYFSGSSLKYTENLSYRGKNKKPFRIIYKENTANGLVPVREIQYAFSGENIRQKSFYKYNGNRKEKEGTISYVYTGDVLQEIRYFTILRPTKKSFMFALQQFSYSDDVIDKRRFIHFEINPDNLKPMQNCQYVILYKNGKIDCMKTWILDSETKKVVEKNNKSITLITKIIKDLDYNYTKKSSGQEFNI